MTHIILIWNEHLSESAATRPMAQTIKPLLEKRGHKVQIKKVPLKYKGSKTTEFGGLERDKVIEHFFYDLNKEHPKAYIMRLHVSPESALTGRKGPEDFYEEAGLRTIVRAGKGSRQPMRRIGFYPVLGDVLTYAIEFPAIFKEAPAGWKKKAETMRHEYEKRYHDRVVDRKATEAAKFLSPVVARKITHLIDTEVQTQEGKFSKPRRTPYRQTRKPKGKRPSHKKPR